VQRRRPWTRPVNTGSAYRSSQCKGLCYCYVCDAFCNAFNTVVACTVRLFNCSLLSNMTCCNGERISKIRSADRNSVNETADCSTCAMFHAEKYRCGSRVHRHHLSATTPPNISSEFVSTAVCIGLHPNTPQRTFFYALHFMFHCATSKETESDYEIASLLILN